MENLLIENALSISVIITVIFSLIYINDPDPVIGTGLFLFASGLAAIYLLPVFPEKLYAMELIFLGVSSSIFGVVILAIVNGICIQQGKK